MRLWQVLVSASMEYLMAIYRRLGVTLTEADMAPESFYNPMLAGVDAELEAAGIAVISDGALCAFPAGFTGRDGAPLPLMLRKSDGGYGYDTTDARRDPVPARRPARPAASSTWWAPSSHSTCR